MMMTSVMLLMPRVDAARAAEVTIRADDEGFGAMKAPSNALVLVSYVGTIVERGGARGARVLGGNGSG